MADYPDYIPQRSRTGRPNTRSWQVEAPQSVPDAQQGDDQHLDLARDPTAPTVPASWLARWEEIEEELRLEDENPALRKKREEKQEEEERIRAAEAARGNEPPPKLDYAPTRGVFLELSEKMSAIVEHRLRTSGWHDEEEEEEEFATFCDDSEKEKVDQDDGEDLDDDPLEFDDEMDGEERRITQFRHDEDTESDSDSDSEDEYQDIFVPSKLEEGAEWDATCTINDVAHAALYYANIFHHTNSKGIIRVYVNGTEMCAARAWKRCVKTSKTWMRALHAGCGLRLNYDPLMTTMFEMVLGWNICWTSGRKKKDRYLNAALDIGGMQEALAEERKSLALTEHEKSAISWGVGKRGARRGGKTRK